MNKATSLKIACILFPFCAATAIASPAQILTTLHSFAGYPHDGAGPGALTRALDGSLYGTTGGGGDNCSPYGCGTVFKVTPAGTETTIYSFCSQNNCNDGVDPVGALVQAADGNFYGITSSGGSGADNAGTVFQITSSGTLTTLYSFCTQPNCVDGRYPGDMVQGSDGNFYGTTNAGGGTDCADGCGTIFKITPSGTLTTLYRFCTQGNCPDGYNPWGLVQATDGNFYGATGHGGASGNGCGGFGCGTIFKITPSGSLTTLYSFCTQTGCPDGEIPNGQLVQATDGNFYGTTSEGGANYFGFCQEFGCGTVFKITPSGTLTTLYSFCSQNNCTDGWEPTSWLVQTTNGNFYGTTYAGGTSTNCDYGCGTIFQITASGTLTTIYSFCSRDGCSDGQLPGAGLVQFGEGNFYGTTDEGGTSNDGTVFRLAIPRECVLCPNIE